MVRCITAALLLCAATSAACGQSPEVVIDAYTSYVEAGITNGRSAIKGQDDGPKALEWVRSDDEKVALKAINLVNIIGKKLMKAGDKEAGELRVKIAESLIAAESDKRKEVAAAAKKALPNVATKDEIAAVRAKMKK